jgi:hypothetical protein
MAQYAGVDPTTGYDKFILPTTVVRGQQPSTLDALFPRMTADTGDPTTALGLGGYVAKGLADAASIPGRMYASIAAPSDESYWHAVSRTNPSPQDDMLSSIAEGIMRDPLTLTAPAAGKALEGTNLLARGLAQAFLAAGNNVANDQPINGAGMATAATGEVAPAMASGLSNFSVPANRVPGEVSGRNFKQWFGNGITDGSGEPRQLYHGTANPYIYKLLPSAEGVYGPGIYLSGSPGIASKYAELAGRSKFPQGTPAPNVIPVYSSMREPFNLNRPVDWDRILPAFNTPVERTTAQQLRRWYPDMPAGHFYDAMTDVLGRELGDDIGDGLGRYTGDDAARSMAERLQYSGYGGLQYPAHEKIIIPGKGYEPQTDNFVVWDPEQVKGVYNSGEWARGGGLMHLNGGSNISKGLLAPTVLNRAAGKFSRNAVDTILNRQGQ